MGFFMRHLLTELMALERLAGGWPQRRKDNFRVEEHEFYVIRMLISPPQCLCNTKLTSHVRCLLPEKKESNKNARVWKNVTPPTYVSAQNAELIRRHLWVHLTITGTFGKIENYALFPLIPILLIVWVVQPNFFLPSHAEVLKKKSGADKKYLQKLLSLSQVDFQKKSLKYLTPLRIGSMVQNTRCQIWRMPEFFNHNFLHDGRGIFGGVLKLLKLEANNLWSMTTRILPRGQRLFCVRKVVIPESDP